MKAINLQLTAQQVQNLYNYLGRVNINGAEALDFVTILNTINNQFQNQMKEDSPKE